MTCRKPSEAAYPTQKDAQEGADALQHKLEMEFFGNVKQPWYPFPCPDGNHWHLALTPQGPAVCPWCRLVRTAWYGGLDHETWVMAAHAGIDGRPCPAATLPALRMIPFTPRRPAWILGFEDVLSRHRSNSPTESRELDEFSSTAASRYLRPSEQRWSPELCNLIAQAVGAGIDVRWLVLSQPGVAIVRAFTEALPDDLPDIPILTELDMPAGYRLPRHGLTGTSIEPGWESDAVTALVPGDAPLLWTPGFQCACDSQFACGSDRADRTTKDVVRRRAGQTTVITAKSTNGRITFMTDHDMKTIAKWIRSNEQQVRDSGGMVLSPDGDPAGELDVVKLVRSFRTKDERDSALTYADCREVTLPAGSTGTVLVVSELPDKLTGYLVEFTGGDGVTVAMPWLHTDDFEVVERHSGRKGFTD